jgi:nucleotide-binding universal stress UspA family protein
MMFKRILLATDGSPVIERAALYVEHLARVEPASVIVIHAYEPPEHYRNTPGYEQLLEHYRAAAQAIVDDAVNALLEDGIHVEGEARVGAPAEVIIDAVAAYDADLVVIGMRGGGGNLAEMLGGVSNRVLRVAKCPVLVIP